MFVICGQNNCGKIKIRKLLNVKLCVYGRYFIIFYIFEYFHVKNKEKMVM